MNATAKSFSVLVISCDAYSDTWPVFFTLFHRYWPDCPHDVCLLSNQERYDDPRVRPLLVGPDAGWSSNLRQGLDRLSAEHVLTFLDDHLILGRIDTARIGRLFDKWRAADGHCLKLFNEPMPDRDVAWDDGVGEFSAGRHYRVSAVMTLWKKATLLDLLVDGETAWDMEIEGSQRSCRYPSGFYAVKNREIFFQNGIERGKWLRYNLPFMRREGMALPTHRRPVMTHGEHLAREARIRLGQRVLSPLALGLKAFTPGLYARLKKLRKAF